MAVDRLGARGRIFVRQRREVRVDLRERPADGQAGRPRACDRPAAAGRIGRSRQQAMRVAQRRPSGHWDGADYWRQLRDGGRLRRRAAGPRNDAPGGKQKQALMVEVAVERGHRRFTLTLVRRI